MASSSRKGKEKMVEEEEEEEEPTYGFHHANNNNNNNNNNDNGGSIVGSFPPGYRFDPCDVELVLYYLKPKVNNERLPPNIMHEIDLYDPLRLEECNPEQLSARYEPQGDGEWYFFTPRDRKYPRGKRPNRAAGSGYWKASGKDAPIEFNGTIVGFKKALVFYEGRAPNGVKTNWIMHEYRLDYDMTNTPQLNQAQQSDRMKLDNWVLFRIHYNIKGENKKRDETSSPKKERKKAPKQAKLIKPSSAESTPESVNIITSHNHNMVINTDMNTTTTTTTIQPSQFEFGDPSDYYLDTTDIPSTLSGGVSGYGGNQSFSPYVYENPTSYPAGWRQTSAFGCNNSNFEVGSCTTIGNALCCNNASNFDVGSCSLSALENATGNADLYGMDSYMEGDFYVRNDDSLFIPDDFAYHGPH